MTPRTIGSGVVRKKNDNSGIISRLHQQKRIFAKSSKTKRPKMGKTTRKRSQNYDGDVTSEAEDSEDIEYADSDNNANVAGADEADSVGEMEDTIGEIQDLQEVHQVN